MTLRFTPDMLRAAYEFLRTTPPFNRWKLPHPKYVKFGVIRSKSTAGEYNTCGKDDHEIRLSEQVIGHSNLLIAVLAHEMVHLRQKQLGQLRPHPREHNACFRRLAAQVCKHHGFDPKAF